MLKLPLERQKTLQEIATFCRPRDFDIKKIAKQLNLYLGELIDLAVKEFTTSRHIFIS